MLVQKIEATKRSETVEQAVITPVTYREAVIRGDYDRYTGNLVGKYDNVRVYWEDQLTRVEMRPYLSTLMAQARKNKMKLRILDLGAGSGQGYDAVTKVNRRDLELGLHHDRVVPEDEVGLYLGLDLDENMVDKGNEIYANRPHVNFGVADLRDGLAAIADKEPAFDLYMSAYGALSHLQDQHLGSLLIDICRHGRAGSIVILDLLGRYSLEWPGYWSASTSAEKWRDYTMSYLNGASGAEAERFPMRYWTGAEIDEFVRGIGADGAHLEVVHKFDRSLMVGRHIDTGAFAPGLKPMRRIVNSLHQDYMRTDLDALLFERRTLPAHPDPTVADFFHELVTSWNTLVQFCSRRLVENLSLIELEHWDSYSTPLQFALMTMDRVINSCGWMWYGDARANVIEPQLGYALRSLESNLERGLGCGHGLLVVAKVVK